MSVARSSGGEIPRGRFGRPVLGLLMDGIDLSYQTALLAELADVARTNNINLLCFAGDELEDDEGSAGPRNRAYELAGIENVDALIISSATLECRIGSPRLSAYLERFRPLPLCSLGVALPDVPSVTIDNRGGMCEAVEHLVVDHGRQRIAFIRGPEVNDEAEQRYRGYVAALRDHQLKPDPQLLLQGDFLTESGAQAIRVLLDERQVIFDAVAAASDEMAIGAMDELRARDIRVPETVAVVGFDDVVEGRYAARPLTTIRQTIAAQASEAVRCVLEQLRGARVADTVTLSTKLVTRRSCGCSVQRDSSAMLPPLQPDQADAQSPLSSRRAQILIELWTAAPELSGTKWADKLLDAFIAQVHSQEEDSFTGVLDDLMEQILSAGQDLRLLQPVITSLHRAAVPPLLQLPQLLLTADALLHEARVLLANMIHHQEAQRRVKAEQTARVLNNVAQDLIASPDTQSLVTSVTRHLPALGIPTCFMSVYPSGSDGPTPAPEETLRLLLAYDQNQPTSAVPRGEVFPMRQLVPRDLLPADRPYAYVVQPLCFRDHPLGIALFELGARDGATYETLRAQISAALERLHLSGEHATKDREPSQDQSETPRE